MDQHRRKAGVAVLSVISNTLLVILKLVIGLITGSVSIISEAIHSGVDLVAALIALFAVRKAGQPADDEHPFGHGKFENISGTIEALLIFVAAIWIVYEAAKKLIHPEPLEAVGLGVAVMLISAVANIIVSQRLFKVGRETDSVALQADGWHLRTDVYTSAGVMLALVVIMLGRRLAPGVDLHWVDPVAAIAVAMLIAKAAYDLTIESGKDLLDVSLSAEEESEIREFVAGWSPTIRGFHRLRTRKAGAHRFIQFHLLVDAAMSVEESHDVHDDIVVALKKRFPGCMVNIHVEPCGRQCTSECIADCLLNKDQRRQVGTENESKIVR